MSRGTQPALVSSPGLQRKNPGSRASPERAWGSPHAEEGPSPHGLGEQRPTPAQPRSRPDWGPESRVLPSVPCPTVEPGPGGTTGPSGVRRGGEAPLGGAQILSPHRTGDNLGSCRSLPWRLTTWRPWAPIWCLHVASAVGCYRRSWAVWPHSAGLGKGVFLPCW